LAEDSQLLIFWFFSIKGKEQQILPNKVGMCLPVLIVFVPSDRVFKYVFVKFLTAARRQRLWPPVTDRHVVEKQHAVWIFSGSPCHRAITYAQGYSDRRKPGEIYLLHLSI
jgi:hypothetical protein